VFDKGRLFDGHLSSLLDYVSGNQSGCFIACNITILQSEREFIMRL
jgi:hypothetical protein